MFVVAHVAEDTSFLVVFIIASTLIKVRDTRVQFRAQFSIPSTQLRTSGISGEIVLVTLLLGFDQTPSTISKQSVISLGLLQLTTREKLITQRLGDWIVAAVSPSPFEEL